MAFWGVEINPGKPFTLSPNESCGRLRISQATLGMGSINNKSYVQCNVGNKKPVMLCVLMPDKAEYVHLESEFDEAEQVTFSVVGPRSVNLSGYFVSTSRPTVADDDHSESFGDDVGESETEDSSDDDEYQEDSFLVSDSDPEVYTSSPSTSNERKKKKSGTRKNSRKRLKKTYESSESEVDGAISQQQRTSSHVPVQIVESEQEDDDQMLISALCERVKIDDEDSKRKRRYISENTTDHQSKDKMVKGYKKKNKKEEEPLNSSIVAKNARTISGGLIVEDLEAGEDGQVASSGKKVTIHYTGRLKKGSQIFDSTAGKDPLKFRLGKGLVMDGLELGIEGMRIGGKRRLQIPPALGYGSEGSDFVPSNSWLIMDVELLRVR